MASSSVTYTSGTNNFNITFPYLRDKHVIVMVGGTLYDIDDNYFTIDASSSTKKVVLTNPVSEGNLGPFVDFVDGSVLTEKQQDESYLHNYYLNQESLEGNLKLGPPILDTDPVTKAYVDSLGIEGGGGTVTGVTAGNGLTGGTITGNGTIAIPTSGGNININAGKVGIVGDAGANYDLTVSGDVAILGTGNQDTELLVKDTGSGHSSRVVLETGSSGAESDIILKNLANGAVRDVDGVSTNIPRFLLRNDGSEEKTKFMTQDSTGTEESTLSSLEILHSNGYILMPNLPTSASGLATGTVYNDSGTLKIVT